MSNNKQTPVQFVKESLHRFVRYDDRSAVEKFDKIFEDAEKMQLERMQEQYQDGREIGKIEILTTQSTNNAGAYSDGYKKGYLAALEYMNSTIENKIKLRQYEQR